MNGILKFLMDIGKELIVENIVTKNLRDQSESVVQQTIDLESWKSDIVFGVENKHDQCCICLTPFTDANPFEAIPCGHKYHSSCLSRLKNEGTNHCAICRMNIRFKNLIDTNLHADS